MNRYLKFILIPVQFIWRMVKFVFDLPEYLLNKIYNNTQWLRTNTFKTWKLKQPLYIQFLIELPIYLLILYLLNLIFNPFGYELTPF